MARFDSVINSAREKLKEYHGNDPLEKARIIGLCACEWYGDMDGEELARARKNIWNDHVSVQAAYAAIMLLED